MMDDDDNITLGTIARDLLVWLAILWEKCPERDWREFLGDVIFVQGTTVVFRGGWSKRVVVDQLFWKAFGPTPKRCPLCNSELDEDGCTDLSCKRCPYHDPLYEPDDDKWETQ